MPIARRQKARSRTLEMILFFKRVYLLEFCQWKPSTWNLSGTVDVGLLWRISGNYILFYWYWGHLGFGLQLLFIANLSTVIISEVCFMREKEAMQCKQRSKVNRAFISTINSEEQYEKYITNFLYLTESIAIVLWI